MSEKKRYFHHADLLALPVFAIAAAYLWSKPEKTTIDIVLLVVAILGFILDAVSAFAYIKRRMLEIKLKREPAGGEKQK